MAELSEAQLRALRVLANQPRYDWLETLEGHETRPYHALARLDLAQRGRQQATIRYEGTTHWWVFRITDAGRAALAAAEGKGSDR